MVEKCAARSAGGAELAQGLYKGHTLGVYRCGEDAVINIILYNSLYYYTRHMQVATIRVLIARRGKRTQQRLQP